MATMSDTMIKDHQIQRYGNIVRYHDQRPSNTALWQHCQIPRSKTIKYSFMATLSDTMIKDHQIQRYGYIVRYYDQRPSNTAFLTPLDLFFPDAPRQKILHAV